MSWVNVTWYVLGTGLGDYTHYLMSKKSRCGMLLAVRQIAVEFEA